MIEMNPERRRGPRYLFIADTEVTNMSSAAKRSARTSELSISGCFIDTRDPAPAGTELRIRISQRNATFTAFGCVISVIPNTGMSIAFTSIEPDQLSVLKKWLPAAI
jgi:PilZ domain